MGLGGVGWGGLPQGMNGGVSPEIAVRVGSASVWITPACSIARKVAVTDLAPKTELLFGVPLIGKALVVLKLRTVVPKPTLALRSMPSCLMTVRFTSATVTFNITWSRPRTVMALTTWLPSV